MSLYAKINSENIVENIIICSDSDISTQSGSHIKITEETREAKINGSYDKESNKFIDPRPYESWILNSDTLIWESPSGIEPTDGVYYWNEDTQEWVLLSE